jgi:neurabin
MDNKVNSANGGQKVSQIANLFQRKAQEDDESIEPQKESAGTVVVRTESHAARFNNARALFERLGEGRVNRPSPFSIKHSTSKDDNLKDPSPERQRSPSPPKKKYVGISNGVGKMDGGVNMIQNVSRIKSEKPEKPEKPERKFNSKELIEKQKNWTSHFSKSRSAASTNVSARCDIIRTVPGTGVINNAEITNNNNNSNNNSSSSNSSSNRPDPVKDLRSSKSSSIESPPSPSKRQSLTSTPPEVRPRTTSRSNSITSPQKLPDVTKVDENNILVRKKSFDYQQDQLPPLPQVHSNSPLPPTSLENHSSSSRRHSSDKDSSLASPAHAISSTPSPAASSSGPSSPVHTEDEKQENESNEKTDVLLEEQSELI